MSDAGSRGAEPKLTWQTLADSLLADAAANHEEEDDVESQGQAPAAVADLSWQQLADSLPPGSPGSLDLDLEMQCSPGSSFSYAPTEGDGTPVAALPDEEQQPQQPQQRCSATGLRGTDARAPG